MEREFFLSPLSLFFLDSLSSFSLYKFFSLTSSLELFPSLSRIFLSLYYYLIQQLPFFNGLTDSWPLDSVSASTLIIAKHCYI